MPTEIASKPITCLFLAPFSILERINRPDLHLNEVEFIWPDMQFPFAGIDLTVQQQMLLAIERADAVIADITDSNPNVMYELGFAHALRKPVLLVAKRGTEIKMPSDILGELYYQYVYGLDELLPTIEQWLDRIVRR